MRILLFARLQKFLTWLLQVINVMWVYKNKVQSSWGFLQAFSSTTMLRKLCSIQLSVSFLDLWGSFKKLHLNLHISVMSHARLYVVKLPMIGYKINIIDYVKGVLYPWALFLKTLSIFSKNKAILDKESYGSGQKCSKEVQNHSFTSVEAIVVKLQWKMCENQYFTCFEL